jgi:AhpC/TSA family
VTVLGTASLSLKSARGVTIFTFLGSLVLGATACGSGAPSIPPELLEPSPGQGGASGDYPSGPYGAEIGSVIEDFSFEGMRDPTSSRVLESISFRDFYDPDAKRGINLLLLNTSAAWCQPCQIEHDDLPARVEKYAPQGFVVFSMLFQSAQNTPADEKTLEVWVESFDTNFPIALDPSYQMGRYGPAGTPPLNLVVDPRDMTILARFIGNQEGPMWEFIEKELDARSP